MSDIPSDVVPEILLRLPAESLLRYRAVCREWRRIIDDPSFVKSHTNNQHLSTTVLIRAQEGNGFCSLSLDFADGRQIIEATPVKTFGRCGNAFLGKLPVASCNGLILVSYYDPDKIWAIWNPLTRDFHELPELAIPPRLFGVGLGYDYDSDDYKVVRIDEWQGVQETSVYSLKSGSWKIIENCPYLFIRYGENRGVFLNGALHWKSCDMVIKLDLNTEEYSQLPLPPSEAKPYKTYLDVLGGSLVLSIEEIGGLLKVWIMKENAWMKLFSRGSKEMPKPVAFFPSKGQFVLRYEGSFILLDIEKNSEKRVDIQIGDLFENSSRFSCQICPGSIFRLDQNYDVCRSVVTKYEKAQRRRANKRRKICATTNIDISSRKKKCRFDLNLPKTHRLFRCLQDMCDNH